MSAAKLSLIAASALLVLQTLAQSPVPESSATPTIKAYSRETIVDVIVTDAKGNAVRNLKRDDFTIKENGKPQRIAGFDEFERAFAAEHTSDVIPHSEVRSNLHAVPTTGPVNILFIDALHLNPPAAYRSLHAVSAYAARMPSGTQVAVFWLGGGGLHLLQGFTTDPASIQRAVSVFRADIGSGLDCYGTFKRTNNALDEVAAYVAGIKGRKNLVWMTPGVPIYLLRDGGIEWGQATSCNDLAAEPVALGGVGSVFTGPNGIETPGLDMTEAHAMMDTYELFTAEQIAVSPLDPRGIIHLGSDQLVAEEVAEQSGGFAKYNSNDLVGELAQVVDAGSHYYTVSYIPLLKDDGHYHHITIQVDRPGVHLTYRRGYNAEQPKQPREYTGPELIKAALQGRIPAATQLIFQASLTAASPASPKRVFPLPAVGSETVDAFAEQRASLPPAVTSPRVAAPTVAGKTATSRAKGKNEPVTRQPYDLLLSVPQSQITYGTALDGSHTVKLQFAFDAYDFYDNFLGSHAQNVDLTLPADRYALFVKAPVVFHEQVDLLPGSLVLRIGVLDLTSNKVGTIEVPVTVPKPMP